jgi:hypothetical protein
VFGQHVKGIKHRIHAQELAAEELALKHRFQILFLVLLV